MAQAKPQIVFITGCTEGGIGAALCEEYLAQGAKVYAGVRRLESLGGLRNKQNLVPVQIDVIKEDSVQKAVQSIIDAEDHIDILVNNAGANSGAGAATEVPLESYRQTFEVNLFGLINVTQQVARHMTKRRKGAIVNIGSVVGFTNTPFAAAYCSSKAAVHMFTDVLRLELAPLGIYVLCVAPGKIKSGFGKAAMGNITYPSKDSPFHSATPAIEHRANFSQLGEKTPTEDMAHAIRLAVDQPAWRRRAYLAYGKSSVGAVVSFYFPVFVRDWILSKVYRTGLVGNK